MTGFWNGGKQQRRNKEVKTNWVGKSYWNNINWELSNGVELKGIVWKKQNKKANEWNRAMRGKKDKQREIEKTNKKIHENK